MVGNAKEQKLKKRRDGGKERKEGAGGSNIASSSFSFLSPIMPRFQFLLLRSSFNELIPPYMHISSVYCINILMKKTDLEQV